jgi:hypothetical protein
MPNFGLNGFTKTQKAQIRVRTKPTEIFIRDVGIGSIVLVPRPSRGVVYCGTINSEFELINDPPWYESYLKLLGETLDDDVRKETWRAADVAQCWKVDEFVPVNLPRIPAWIRQSFFGQSTYGRIYPDSVAGEPLGTLNKIMHDQSFERRNWTRELSEISRRLSSDVTPTAFEHLVVSLLQLEHPDEAWTHIGGSGDGGVDGIGADEKTGRVTSLLQCKRRWDGGDSVFPADSVWTDKGQPQRQYLGTLSSMPNTTPKDFVVLDRERIAELVLHHCAKLSQAMSMRIGSPP